MGAVAVGSEADCCRFIRDAGVSPSVTPFRAREANAGEGGGAICAFDAFCVLVVPLVAVV